MSSYKLLHDWGRGRESNPGFVSTRRATILAPSLAREQRDMFARKNAVTVVQWNLVASMRFTALGSLTGTDIGRLKDARSLARIFFIRVVSAR
jgi:hypothetical protein